MPEDTVRPAVPRAIYRVRPVESGWRIELAGDSLAEHAEDKHEAVERAKTLARRAPHGGVVVLDEDGRVETELQIDGVAT